MNNINLEGLIPLIGGLLATLLGWGIIKPKSAGNFKKVSGVLKICGPLTILFGVFLLTGIGQTDKSVDLETVATQIKLKLKLPVMVDSETRLDDVRTTGKLELGYFLTLVHLSHSDEKLAPILAVLEKSVRESACANPNYKSFFEDGVSLRMTYQTNDAVEALKVILKADSCRN